jgi:hypothetical protein
MDGASQPDPQPDRQYPPYLRLVWSRPLDLDLDVDDDAPPPPPRRLTNLAVAIDRQMSGEYGLSNEQFAQLFALGQHEEPGPPPLRTVSS